MRLTKLEFKSMNSAARRLLQRTIEFPLLRKMGLTAAQRDILEIGCGSGYGAALLATLSPRSYVGVDLMPEQIALAQKRQLAGAEFMIGDVTDTRFFLDASKDIVVIFGVLHHIPEWRAVIQACHRILRPDGQLFVEEPDGRMMAVVHRLLPDTHPKEAFFQLEELEAQLVTAGFTVFERRWAMGLGLYGARKSTNVKPQMP
jgi:SAM-dependent methyltransferase